MSALPLIGLDCFLSDFDDGCNRLADSAGQGHRISAGGEIAVPFLENRFGQNRSGGRAVAGNIAGLAGGFLHQLGADVFVFVLELNFLGDGYAVLGNRRSPPSLIDHRVSPAGAQGRFHGPGQFDHTLQEDFSVLRHQTTSSFAAMSILLQSSQIRCDDKPGIRACR